MAGWARGVGGVRARERAALGLENVGDEMGEEGPEEGEARADYSDVYFDGSPDCGLDVVPCEIV